ncbi:hypothetical protein [Hymenobacter guriensis]|uniref:Uncharacterized protein n=1 Tax=Hymenobacter guriensis TaxID=2793065 RepID=A0ABS0KXT7_9BACT|nr:hypothetical protein [Hymenobacter guriensis]MBG8551927.1 hypothetical protein [Hymenobacter guriensis]
MRNSLQLYIARPGVAAVPVSTALPEPAASTPITSFKRVSAKLDLPGDFAIGVKGNDLANQVQVDGVVYRAGRLQPLPSLSTPTAPTC